MTALRYLRKPDGTMVLQQFVQLPDWDERADMFGGYYEDVPIIDEGEE